jgi:hypothetical protein
LRGRAIAFGTSPGPTQDYPVTIHRKTSKQASKQNHHRDNETGRSKILAYCSSPRLTVSVVKILSSFSFSRPSVLRGRAGG